MSIDDTLIQYGHVIFLEIRNRNISHCDFIVFILYFMPAADINFEHVFKIWPTHYIII